MRYDSLMGLYPDRLQQNQFPWIVSWPCVSAEELAVTPVAGSISRSAKDHSPARTNQLTIEQFDER